MDNEVRIQAGGVTLEANLQLPMRADGLVVFAQGNGNSRFSMRQRLVADVLNSAGLGTLLLDPLTPEEQTIDADTHEFRRDIPLLGERLILTLDWLRRHEDTKGLAIGLFGAGTGAAAALLAAVARPDVVQALVSRGGRVDLADDVLDQVRAPILLLVGSHDSQGVARNREAFARLGDDKRIEIIPGATQLFKEAGKLEAVARQARDWFVQHLDSRPS